MSKHLEATTHLSGDKTLHELYDDLRFYAAELTKATAPGKDISTFEENSTLQDIEATMRAIRHRRAQLGMQKEANQ